MSDYSANYIGIIGDSADKRFTFVRTDGRVGDPSPPEFIHIIDWGNEKWYGWPFGLSWENLEIYAMTA